MIDDRLRYLLLQYYQKRASADERDELMELLRNGVYDEEARYLIAELIGNQSQFGEVLENTRAEEILRNIFLSEAPENEGEDIFSGEEPYEFKPLRPVWMRVLRSLPVAASVALLAFLGTYWVMKGNPLALFGQAAATDDTTLAESAGQLPPAAEKALLTLWDGTVFSLDTARAQLSGRPGGTPSGFEIDREKGEIVYNGTGARTGYNSLSTPLGGQYKLVLPDGSKAWLNAGSTLKFPTSFDARNRRVEVTGEVFFDVKTDSSRPFIVSLPNQKIKGVPIEIAVLGTEFNVSSYSDDPVMQTTLVKGRVEVKKGREVKVLSPGEQAEVKKVETGESEIEVRHVDAQSVAAWKEGMFEFDGSIEVIMRQISRWYAVEVEYEGNVGEKAFMGTISRKESASEVLKFLEMTGGIGFEIKGNKIKVKAI